MKLIAVLALACGFTAAPMVAAGTASALPGTCDGANCVPYVDHNVDPSAPCVFGSRYPYGLDATGGTYVCNAANEWVQSEPLIGVRTLRAPCDDNQPGVAQSADGQPLNCESGGWSAHYDNLYYSGAR